VALAAALALAAAGVIEPHDAIAGFGDPTVILIASLFVVSQGLEAAGLTAWAGHQLTTRAATPKRTLAMLFGLAALVAAIITANGAIAALVPVAVVLALRSSIAPSRVLMPAAFAATAGGLLALTGMPVNVIVSDAAAGAGAGHFAFFSFALVGVPLVIGTIAICLLLGDRLLPERTARTIPPNLSEHARTLAHAYAIPDPLITATAGAAEVIIPPRSELIGETFFPGMITPTADLVVLAIHRGGEEQDGPTELAAGDILLLHGEWRAFEGAGPDVLFVEDPLAVRRQAVPLGEGAKRMTVILLAMVVLLATGVIPAFIAALAAAGAVIVAGVLSADDAYHAVRWSAVLLIGAMIAVSGAIASSGAAEDLAGVLIGAVGDAGPRALLLGLFLLTFLLGQVVSNTATALIVAPIAISAAADLGVSVRPVLMCVAVGACTSFLTPIATTANMIVLGPGGYRFGDFWRLGLCLSVLFGIVAVLLVPVFWGL
jgi:di/tricarboxylate transporter